MRNDLIGSAAACARLKVSRPTLVRMVADGRLPAALKMPGQSGAYLFNPEVVEELAEQRELQRECDRFVAR